MSWYDAEGQTEGATETYEVVVPQVAGDLYIMVDGYPYGTIPIDGDVNGQCLDRAYT